MANSVVVDGKKFYELIAVDVRWLHVKREPCATYTVVRFKVDFIEPQGEQDFIYETNSTVPLKGVVADELFFKYIIKSLHRHSRIFVSIHTCSDGGIVQGVLPDVMPICNKSDEKKLSKLKSICKDCCDRETVEPDD